MRAINKGQEPRELTEYRCKPNAVYDGPLFTTVKQAIREQLLREQGYLCAYCMKRIDDHQMKVEHWHCQDNYPDEQLDYKNMLGVFLGHEGEPFKQQTCDTRKGNRDLKYNPTNPGHRIEIHIRFFEDGKIESDDVEFNEQIADIPKLNKFSVLNLNEFMLINNRRSIWKSIQYVLARKPGSRTSAEIQELLEQWSKPDQQGQLQEYCAVAVYYLRKRLKRLEKSNAGR